MTTQNEAAITLRALHIPGEPLVLCNVWDAASAAVVSRVPGVKALATASWSVSESNGYRDGEGMPLAIALGAIQRVVEATSLPVTADFEKGYAVNLENLASTIHNLIATGAVGLNLEDSRGAEDGTCWSLDEAAARVATVRAVANQSGVALVINARTDVLLGGAPLDQAIARGRAYLEAGADCIFLLGAEEDDLARAIREIPGPVSVMATAGGPGVAELARLGVARVSVGPGSMGVAYAALDRFARSLGTSDRMPAELGFRPGRG